MIAPLSLITIVALSDLLHSRGLSVPTTTGSPLPPGPGRRGVLIVIAAGLIVAVALSTPWWALPGVVAGVGAWLFTYDERSRAPAMVVTAVIALGLIAPAFLAPPAVTSTAWARFQVILLAVAVVLVNLTTANRVVRMVLRLTGAPQSTTPPGPPDGEPRAGRVIGVLERYLLIALIVAGQGISIAGIAAAKSIIRYPEISKAARDGGGLSAEVFFVGTVTSWLIALASAGLVVLAV